MSICLWVMWKEALLSPQVRPLRKHRSRSSSVWNCLKSVALLMGSGPYATSWTSGATVTVTPWTGLAAYTNAEFPTLTGEATSSQTSNGSGSSASMSGVASSRLSGSGGVSGAAASAISASPSNTASRVKDVSWLESRLTFGMISVLLGAGLI